MIKTLSKIPAISLQNVVNIPGWRTKRKLIVFESDDWGSIRMPSKDVFESFVSRGMDIWNSNYNRFDTIESNDDLTFLFEVLGKYKDYHGNHPAFTANIVVGNPDFARIEETGYNEYFFESVVDTLKKYPNREQVLSLWKQGESEGLFHPQFHGREHVNVIRWMEALKRRTPEIMFTFSKSTTFSGEGDYNYMEVLDYNTMQDLKVMRESIVEGLDLFERIFGYRSKSFIPPCYTWSSEIEETLARSGVAYIQGLVVQSIPTGSFGVYKKKYHFLGQKNFHGQYYLIRNCFFEPALSKKYSTAVDDCLNRIKIAFRWHKPAIISSHRINFIGALDKENRGRNLILLNDLLNRALKIWPDIEFINSDQLGDMISTSN